MIEVVNYIINSWKELIENLEANGFNKKIESTHFFKMDKYYTGYPHIKDCYKVTFDFGLDCGNKVGDEHTIEISKRETWNSSIESLFTNLFTDDINIIITNTKIDYITIQGGRIIIQFYPKGFIEDIRNEKLLKLDI